MSRNSGIEWNPDALKKAIEDGIGEIMETTPVSVECPECGSEVSVDAATVECPNCGLPIEVKVEKPKL